MSYVTTPFSIDFTSSVEDAPEMQVLGNTGPIALSFVPSLGGHTEKVTELVMGAVSGATGLGMVRGFPDAT